MVPLSGFVPPIVSSKLPGTNLYTLQGTNISRLGKRKIIFKHDFWWDMLVHRRVLLSNTPAKTKNFGLLTFITSEQYNPHQTHNSKKALKHHPPALQNLAWKPPKWYDMVNHYPSMFQSEFKKLKALFYPLGALIELVLTQRWRISQCVTELCC